VNVTLEGATFLTTNGRTYNSFWGSLDGDRLTFFMQDPSYYYYAPDVLELLAPNTYFYMGGSVPTALSRNGRSGLLSGVIGTMEGPPSFTFQSWCRSFAHRFELVRR
jgi:hypothetical protein